MALDEGLGDDDPQAPLLPPDDRIWRHPSEVAGDGTSRGDEAPPPDRGRRLWPVAVGAWALAGIVVGVAVGASGLLGGRERTVAVPAVELVVAPGSMGPMSAPPEAIIGIAEHLRAAIVTVRAEGPRGPGQGAGVMFRSDGHVLTSNHVVDGAAAAVVIMADGSQLGATVVGGDAETDVAVVKLRNPPTEVVPAVIGSAAGLRVGQMAMAFGAPGRGDRPTIAVGIIRSLGVSAQTAGRPALADMIQT
ncbi:MAG: trypsin-like peptidase domain-containing protein, partial [Acidimicrobiales bacterium]